MAPALSGRSRHNAERFRERMTSEEGRRMRCILGAKAAHAAMRTEGRTPGDEGRAVITSIERSAKENASLTSCGRLDIQVLRSSPF